MESNNNFERAKKLTESWPAWKRDYQLTKYSKSSPENNTGDQKTAQCDEQAKNIASRS